MYETSTSRRVAPSSAGRVEPRSRANASWSAMSSAPFAVWLPARNDIARRAGRGLPADARPAAAPADPGSRSRSKRGFPRRWWAAAAPRLPRAPESARTRTSTPSAASSTLSLPQASALLSGSRNATVSTLAIRDVGERPSYEDAVVPATAPPTIAASEPHSSATSAGACTAVFTIRWRQGPSSASSVRRVAAGS